MFCHEISIYFSFPNFHGCYFFVQITEKFILNLQFLTTKLLAEEYSYSTVLLLETHLVQVNILSSCLDKFHPAFYFLLTGY